MEEKVLMVEMELMDLMEEKVLEVEMVLMDLMELIVGI